MCFEYVIRISADIAAVVGAFITVFIFRRNVKRERKILTIKAFSEFRNKFPLNTKQMSLKKKKEYLREIEFLCVGINNGVYDFKILQKMSGRRLLSQYDNGMGNFVALRCQRTGKDDDWCEYKKVIIKLRKHYCIDELIKLTIKKQ